MLKKDKQKVIGEELNDEQIQRFLEGQATGSDEIDYQILERAYRGLRADDFDRFMVFFSAQKRNINATGPEGSTLLSQIKTHAQSGGYSKTMQEHGAN